MSKTDGHINDTEITDALVAEHGLTPDEFQMVCAHMGRTPNYTELGCVFRHVVGALLL